VSFPIRSCTFRVIRTDQSGVDSPCWGCLDSSSLAGDPCQTRQHQPFPEQPVPGQDVAVTAIFPVLTCVAYALDSTRAKQDSPTQFDLPNRDTMQPRPTYCGVVKHLGSQFAMNHVSIRCRYGLLSSINDTLLAGAHYPPVHESGEYSNGNYFARAGDQPLGSPERSI
jgi:hypothetical protein